MVNDNFNEANILNRSDSLSQCRCLNKISVKIPFKVVNGITSNLGRP